MKKNLLEEWIAHCDNAIAIGQEPCLESFAAIQTTADSLKAWAEHGITEQMITDFINQLSWSTDTLNGATSMAF